MEQKIPFYFEEVKDPRVVGRCDHLLSDILIIAICTCITGGTDYEDMYLFGKERGEQLKGSILELPNGAPSSHTYRRVFNQLEVESLKTCLKLHGKEILDGLAEKQIILDGKKLKGVSPTRKGNAGCYILNAWAGENRICVGQKKVEDKSNEITAIPAVIASLDIEDAVVSIDAVGTQVETVKQIREKKGHYFLSVKKNQKGLLVDLECAFKIHQGIDSIEQIEKDHGRIETRRCSILPAQDYLLKETLEKWTDLTTLVKIDASREIKGVLTKETRYYISDENVTKASYYRDLCRGHWGIENQLHWHLDVTFKEDDCRARTGNAPENLTTIRKFALQIVSNAKDKHSMKKRLYKAALDIEYMKKLIKSP